MSSIQRKCFNAGVNLGMKLRAAFSTTPAAQAGDRVSSASDLLAQIAASTSSSTTPSSRPKPQVRSNASSGPINIPNRKGGLQNLKSNGSFDRLTGLISKFGARNQRKKAAEMLKSGSGVNMAEAFEQKALADGLGRQIKRNWKAGDTYAPHDLSFQEQQKWGRLKQRKYDVFDITNFNPLDHYKNFAVMSEYMTPMGRIMHRKDTGLRPVNQRRIAKAIRRSIGMGIMPSVHKHPELLQASAIRAHSLNSGGFGI